MIGSQVCLFPVSCLQRADPGRNSALVRHNPCWLTVGPAPTLRLVVLGIASDEGLLLLRGCLCFKVPGVPVELVDDHWVRGHLSLSLVSHEWMINKRQLNFCQVNSRNQLLASVPGYRGPSGRL